MVNKPNISTLAHNDCCGCHACGDACPTQCISFKKDDESFLYPEVDESKCIHCGKCVSCCPEFTPRYNDAVKSAMAAYATSPEVRQAGSSGGLFGVFASLIIQKGGKVWGAAFDENLKLKHTCATTLDELEPLLRSNICKVTHPDVTSR